MMVTWMFFSSSCSRCLPRQPVHRQPGLEADGKRLPRWLLCAVGRVDRGVDLHQGWIGRCTVEASAEDQAAGRHRGKHADRRGVAQSGPVQAEVGDGHPGGHDGDTERHVGSDEVRGDQAGPLARRGQAAHGPEGAQDACPEARARHRGPGQENDSRRRLDAGEGHHHAGERVRQPASMAVGPLSPRAATEAAAPVAWSGKITTPAPQKVRRAEHPRGQRRALQQVKPAEHPHRDQARQGHRERPRAGRARPPVAAARPAHQPAVAPSPASSPRRLRRRG